MTRKASEKHVAYHEAGHVIAMLFYGIKIEEVSIIPIRGESAGRVIVAEVPENMRLCDVAIVDYAGWMAERRQSHSAFSLGPAKDAEHAEMINDELYRMGWNRCRKKLTVDAEQNARRLVSAYWPVVEKIALALFDKKVLTYEQVIELSKGMM